MNQARSSGAPVVATLGGTKRSLRRLSRRDIGVLIERMPAASPADRMFISVFDVHRWAHTAEGAAVVIAIASLPRDYHPDDLTARLAEVESGDGSWGSMVQQSVVASNITAESVTSGEEPTSEGEQRPDPPDSPTCATTSTKPD